MTDEQFFRPSVTRVLQSEEAVYGLILVSGMIVVSNSIAATSIAAFFTVLITVIVFFMAHVYAGTLARMAATDGAAGFMPSVQASARHSLGMLLASVPPLIILLLGATRVVDDEAAIWSALILDTLLLGALGWFAVSRWTVHLWPRLVSALITATFGLILVALKALIHH